MAGVWRLSLYGATPRGENARHGDHVQAAAGADIARARELFAEYARLLLDTLAGMREALTLYRKPGFREIAPYSSTPGAICFELAL